MKTVGLIILSVADGRLFFFVRSYRGGTGFFGRLMPARHLLFYLRFAGGFLAPRPFVHPTLPVRAAQAGLSTAERRGKRRSQPRWRSAAAVGCVPPKGDKNPPGMRFPAPDSRRIEKSHIPGSADFTLLRHQVRNREYFIIAMFSLSQAGATPGAGLQTVRAGSGR